MLIFHCRCRQCHLVTELVFINYIINRVINHYTIKFYIFINVFFINCYSIRTVTTCYWICMCRFKTSDFHINGNYVLRGHIILKGFWSVFINDHFRIQHFINSVFNAVFVACDHIVILIYDIRIANIIWGICTVFVQNIFALKVKKLRRCKHTHSKLH